MKAQHTCELCESEANLLPRKVEDKWPLYCCAACNLQFLHPQPHEEELKDLYEKGYFKSWGMEQDSEPDFLRKMKKATFRRQLKFLHSRLPAGEILDVGCATGLFMEAANEMGYSVWGLDISVFAAGIARKKFGEAAVFVGQLAELAKQKRKFDAINMSDYIEHVRHPAEILSTANALLRPGGYLVIQTPDTGSLSSHIMGKTWTHYKMEHLYYFDQKSMQKAAEKAGFETVLMRRAKKALNATYIRHQFSIYRHGFLWPLSRFIYAVLPRGCKSTNLMIPAGELFAIFRKPV